MHKNANVLYYFVYDGKPRNMVHTTSYVTKITSSLIYLLERYQELVGEYRNHLDGGLSISPTAAEMFKTRVVDTGEEAKYQDVIQQVTVGAYEQPCQLFNITVRFATFWEWNQVFLISKPWIILECQNFILNLPYFHQLGSSKWEGSTTIISVLYFHYHTLPNLILANLALLENLFDYYEHTIFLMRTTQRRLHKLSSFIPIQYCIFLISGDNT